MIEDFAAKLPMAVISVMLGVPREDQDELREWSDAMLHREEGSAELTPGGHRRARPALRLLQRRDRRPPREHRATTWSARSSPRGGRPLAVARPRCSASASCCSSRATRRRRSCSATRSSGSTRSPTSARAARRPVAHPGGGRRDAALRHVDPGARPAADPRRRAARHHAARRHARACCCSDPRTATSAAGTSPTASTSAATRPATSRSATGSTTASARRSPGSRPGSRSRCCCPVLGEYAVDATDAERVHSGNVRGFSRLPVEIPVMTKKHARADREGPRAAQPRRSGTTTPTTTRPSTSRSSTSTRWAGASGTSPRPSWTCSATSPGSTCSSTAAAPRSGRSSSRASARARHRARPVPRPAPPRGRRRSRRPASPSQLVCASATAVPLRDASFDVVFCDHGAMSFCDPYRTVPEVARLLRPGGLFAFNISTLLRNLCYPPGDPDAPVTRKLHAKWFGARAFDWGDGTIDFQIPHGEWITPVPRARPRRRGPARAARRRSTPRAPTATTSTTAGPAGGRPKRSGGCGSGDRGRRDRACSCRCPRPSRSSSTHRLAPIPVAPLGVPAHITVLYPFIPPDAARRRRCERAIADVLRGFAAFDFALRDVRRFPDGVLYLAPEPVEPFARAHRGVRAPVARAPAVRRQLRRGHPPPDRGDGQRRAGRRARGRAARRAAGREPRPTRSG